MAHQNRSKCAILIIKDKQVSIFEGGNTVGRHREAMVVLKDIVASQHHAIITVIDDCHYVFDLHSTNGTKLNNVQLIPFKMYKIEDGSTLEFTPTYVGKYRTLNASQSMIDANGSQMTPVEDSFFAATTQLQMTQLAASITNMIESQTQPNGCLVEEVVYIHDQDTQVMPIAKIQADNEQVNITVPTINDAATQIVNVESALSAFVDSQAFNTQASHEKVSDVLLNEENPNLNSCNVQLSSGETSQALNASLTSKPAPTNCSLSTEGFIQGIHAEIGENLKLLAENSPKISEGKTEKSSEGSDTDIDDESLMEVADNALNESIRNLEADTKHSESSNTEKMNIADLSTQTVDPDTQLTEERMIAVNGISTVCSLNLQLSETLGDNTDNTDSNESVDMLVNNLKKAKHANNAETSEETPSTSEATELKDDLIVDSDESEEFLNVNAFKSPGQNSSAKRISRFILSDSEEENDDKTVTSLTKPANDTFSDYDDSFVQRKSIGNISCIPATQDASFSGIANESYKHGLSNIQEMSGLADISSLRNYSRVESSVLEEQSVANDDNIEDTQIIDYNVNTNSENESMSVDFLAPTQNINVPVTKTAKSDKNVEISEDDFLLPTQKVDISVQKSPKHTEHPNDDDDFLAPTQQLNPTSKVEEEKPDDDFLAPTQVIAEPSTSRRPESEDLFDFEAATQKLVDDGVFCAPTQTVSGFAKSTKLRNSSKISKVDDCLGAETWPTEAKTSKEKKRVSFMPDETSISKTQLSLVEQKEKSLNESKIETLQTAISEADADFDAPTQTVVNSTKQINAVDNNDDDAFDAPTQQIVNDDRAAIAYTEAETQDIGELIAPIAVAKVPEVESQLEVMFESQNVSLSAVDASRPLNPMANTLETSTTQDVIDSLSGAKRLSDDFGDDRSVKRAKTTPEIESKTTPNIKGKPGRRTKSETSKITPRTSRRISKKVSINEVNNNPSTSKNKSILEFIAKPNESMTEETSKPTTSLSLKRKDKVVNEREHFLSNNDDYDDEVECLDDIIPESNDLPKIIVEVVDVQDTNNVTTNSDILDSTVARKNKRRLLDEETMNTMPSPVVKLTRLSSQDESCLEDKRSPPESIRKLKFDEKTKTEKSDTSKRTRKTRSKHTRSSESEEEPEKKPEKRKPGRPPGRASTRQKKTVDYKEKPTKASTSRRTEPSPQSSDDDTALVINVPDYQVKLTSIDGAGLQAAQKKLRNSIVEDVKPVGRRGRPRGKTIKEEAQSIVSTPPDKTKRATKPKVIFTMLDEPKLNHIIRKLGGSVVDQLKTSTVLVTSKVQRTLKLLSAIANSIPICSPEWLYECKKANEFLDPWDHLIKDPQAEKLWKFSIRDTLEKSKRGKIFAGYQFMLFITLSIDVIKGAIEANGGKVVTRKPAGDNWIVVGASSKREKFEVYLKSNVRVVSSEFVLVGILRQELCFDEFKFA